jgi:cation diffusion facilitator family transporter
MSIKIRRRKRQPRTRMNRAASEITTDGLAKSRAKQRVATASVVASGGIATLKLIVGALTGSLGLLAEGAHSLFDLVSTMITFLVIGIAAVPPDADHPYGHERAENLGALAGMALLAATALFILYHAFEKIFFSPAAPQVNVWSFGVLAIALIVDLYRVRALRKASKDYGSQALASDAEHFTNDMLGTVAVLAGLLVVLLSRSLTLPDWLVSRADAFAATIVACVALRSAWRLGTEAIRALMGDVPIALTERLKQRVESLDGVVKGSTELRTHFVGPRPYVDVTLGTPRGGSLESAHLLTEVVEKAIRAELAGAQATVHVEPKAIPHEGPAASLRAVADRLGLRVHNVNIYLIGDETRIDLDLELPDSLSLAQAHKHSEDLEYALRHELSDRVRMAVHLEPRSDKLRPAERRSSSTRKVRAVLSKLPQAANTRVRDALVTDEGLVVTLEREFPGEMSLRETHEAMTELERDLKLRVPDIVRVHVDPEILHTQAKG